MLCSVLGINILWYFILICTNGSTIVVYCMFVALSVHYYLKHIVLYNLMCEMLCIQLLELSRMFFIILYISTHVVMLVTWSNKYHIVLVYAKL